MKIGAFFYELKLAYPKQTFFAFFFVKKNFLKKATFLFRTKNDTVFIRQLINTSL